MTAQNTAVDKAAQKLAGNDINPRVNELAGKLKGKMTLEKDGVIGIEKGTYEETLPEELTMKTVQAVYRHNEDLVSALTLATAEMAEPAMKKDKKLEQVSSELPVEGKGVRSMGAINVGYIREQERTVRNPAKPDEPAKQVTSYGVTTARISTFGSRNRGELKKVKSLLSDRAEGLFK